MDQTKQPGISIARINLLDCECHLGDPPQEGALSFNLTLKHLERSIAEGDKVLNFVASFDLMSGIKNPVCQLTCTYLAVYTRPESANMNWAEFSNAMALTHLIPFLREFIVDMMSRMPIPVLILPPINVPAMIEQYTAQSRAPAIA